MGFFNIESYEDSHIILLYAIDYNAEFSMEAANRSAKTVYRAVIAFMFDKYDTDEYELPEQVINCDDGSGEVTEGLGEALKYAMRYSAQPGYAYVCTYHGSNDKAQIFVQWRASEDSTAVSQYPHPSSQPSEWREIFYETFE